MAHAMPPRHLSRRHPGATSCPESVVRIHPTRRALAPCHLAELRGAPSVSPPHPEPQPVGRCLTPTPCAEHAALRVWQHHLAALPRQLPQRPCEGSLPRGPARSRPTCPHQHVLHQVDHLLAPHMTDHPPWSAAHRDQRAATPPHPRRRSAQQNREPSSASHLAFARSVAHRLSFGARHWRLACSSGRFQRHLLMMETQPSQHVCIDAPHPAPQGRASKQRDGLGP